MAPLKCLKTQYGDEKAKGKPSKVYASKNWRLVIILLFVVVVVEQRFLFCFSSHVTSYHIRGIFFFFF